LHPQVPKISGEVSEKIRNYNESIDALRLRFFRNINPSKSQDFHFAPTSLLVLGDCIDISRPFPVSSHRRFSGRFVIFSKKMAMHIASPLIRLLFKRQIIFNDNMMLLAQAFVAMESKINHLETLLGQQSKNEKTNTSL